MNNDIYEDAYTDRTQPLKMFAVISVKKGADPRDKNSYIHSLFVARSTSQVLNQTADILKMRNLDPLAYDLFYDVIVADMYGMIPPNEAKEMAAQYAREMFPDIKKSEEQQKVNPREKGVNDLVAYVRYVVNDIGTDVEKKFGEKIVDKFIKKHNPSYESRTKGIQESDKKEEKS